MKHNKRNRIIAAVTAVMVVLTMVIGASTVAFANDGEGYISFGADLSQSEKDTVMGLFGLSDTSGCTVLTVTNEEEHKYLDGYVDSSQIGTKALSSVLIKPNDGTEITITTHNIGYCTSDMYKNALETAGVEGADVTVAGPFTISGTAALVGIIKAYEEMTGENVSDKVVEGAVDELTTTGDVGEDIGSMDKAAEIVADVKEEIANNPDMSGEEIEQTIRDAADNAGVNLSEDNVQKIKGMVDNLKGLGIDWKNLVDLDQARGFFTRIVDWFKNLLGI